VVVVCAFEAAVPVTVMPYRTVVVRPTVVIVADAMAGGVTEAGLTVQVGVSTVACGCAGVTWQLRSTVPLNPFTVPTVTCADDPPPGATASSDRGPACRVKLCADVHDGKPRKAANRHKAEIPANLFRAYLRPAMRRVFEKDCKKDLANKDLANKDCNASEFCDSDGDDSDLNMSRFRFN
jgi:hypothetical protein